MLKKSNFIFNILIDRFFTHPKLMFQGDFNNRDFKIKNTRSPGWESKLSFTKITFCNDVSIPLTVDNAITGIPDH